MSLNNRIKYTIEEKVAYVGFGFNSKKAMAVLDKETLEELKELVGDVKKLVKEKKIDGLIFHSVLPGCFLAGVDINLISSFNTEAEIISSCEEGHSIFSDIEDLSIPTIACIDGVCMGGGLELSLATNHILLSDSNKTILSLPEVKLGLLPGLGGTYRLPKRVGVPSALDMILTGKNIRAKKAKRMGLAREVYAKERLLSQAVILLKENKKEKVPLKKSLEKCAMDNFVTRKLIFQKARESVLKKTKGFYQAPLKILDVMENGATNNRKHYLSREAQAFSELALSEQSGNLRHIFFLMEGSKKLNGESTTSFGKKITRGAVLGAGTMGGGIAWLMADNGMAPILKDINVEALELGLDQSSKIFKKALKRKRLSNDDFERKQRSIRPSLDFNGFKRTDLVIEAIVENIEIKKKVFAELEKEMRDDAIISTNTSSLSIEEMAKALEMPERFIGMHFFNPVNMMPLLEIITHPKVSDDVVKAMHAWALKVKKTPIVVNDGPGFLVNRILAPFLNEACYLLEEGLPIKELDEAITNFGMPMGPCRLLDEVGFDIGLHASQIIHKGLGDRMKPCSFLTSFVDKGFLGKKNSKGFYLYDEKGRHTEINQEMDKLMPSKTIKMSEVAIQKRVILPMINEAAYCLQDKIAPDAATVDVGVIFGLGFPPFRGGLLKYADFEGLDNIHKSIEELSATISAVRFEPSSYLKELTEKKKKFYD